MGFFLEVFEHVSVMVIRVEEKPVEPPDHGRELSDCVGGDGAPRLVELVIQQLIHGVFEGVCHVIDCRALSSLGPVTCTKEESVFSCFHLGTTGLSANPFQLHQQVVEFNAELSHVFIQPVLQLHFFGRL